MVNLYIICSYVTGFVKRDFFDKIFKSELSSHSNATCPILSLIFSVKLFGYLKDLIKKLA